MESDDPVRGSAVPPATAPGRRRKSVLRLGFVHRTWRVALVRAMRAPPWAYAGLAGLGLMAAVILALY